MDITKQNFEIEFPRMKRAIDGATFIAIDTEFSGLFNKYRPNRFDTLPKYFNDMQYHCKNFMIMQLGVSAFKLMDDGTFSVDTYNVYCFSRSITGNSTNRLFVGEAASLEFLANNGMAINRVITEGVSFMNAETESTLRKNLANDYDSCSKPLSRLLTTAESRSAILNIIRDVRNFISDENAADLVFLIDEPELMPGFVCTLRQRFGRNVHLKTAMQGRVGRLMVGRRLSDAQWEDYVDTIVQAELGVSKLVHYIAASGKLVVGHNVLLDLLHIVDKFITCFPMSYDIFKNCVHSLFKNFIDTKLLINQNEHFMLSVNNSDLGSMVKYLEEPRFEQPVLVLNEASLRYLEQEQLHESGYDAFVTGRAFLTMWNHLRIRNGMGMGAFSNYDLIRDHLNGTAVNCLENRPVMQFDGPDTRTSRSHVFHIRFPAHWQFDDLACLFAPFGAVRILFIEQDAAYVALENRGLASKVLSKLAADNGTVYHLQTYAQEQSGKRKAEAASHNETVVSAKRCKCTSDETVAESSGGGPSTSARPKTFDETDSWE